MSFEFLSRVYSDWSLTNFSLGYEYEWVAWVWVEMDKIMNRSWVTIDQNKFLLFFKVIFQSNILPNPPTLNFKATFLQSQSQKTKPTHIFEPKPLYQTQKFHYTHPLYQSQKRTIHTHFTKARNPLYTPTFQSQKFHYTHPLTKARKVALV